MKLNKIKYPGKNEWDSLCKRPVYAQEHIDEIVCEIFNAVKINGDSGIKHYTAQFGETLENINIQSMSGAQVRATLPPELAAAIDQAFINIYAYHKLQIRQQYSIETMPGVTCSVKYVPLQKPALYIPGGSAPLFSTVLMLGIPALLAGCTDTILLTPVKTGEVINPAILYAAIKCSINNIYTIGGIPAIAAATFGTETISKANKIFGPGNQYVAAAKNKAHSYGLASDLPAGPSEVLVIADDTAVAEFVAADLIAQAEHGPDSQVILLTTSEALADEVDNEIEKQLRILPRAVVAGAALENSKTIIFSDLNSCVEFSNEYAPEHLILSCIDAEDIIDSIVNAGSVFIGNYTPESLGDYASGTNHTLPTNGFARSYSGVSVSDFQKTISIQKATEKGLQVLGPIVETMAEAELLAGHKNAVSVRLNKLAQL